MNRSHVTSQSSRREALFVALLWVVSCLYTVGYAALFAYRKEPNPHLLLGMPSWVFWGVIAPWAVCTFITIWFAFCGMQEEALGEEPSIPQPPPSEKMDDA
jgi:hypothetical protein